MYLIVSHVSLYLLTLHSRWRITDRNTRALLEDSEKGSKDHSHIGIDRTRKRKESQAQTLACSQSGICYIYKPKLFHQRPPFEVAPSIYKPTYDWSEILVRLRPNSFFPALPCSSLLALPIGVGAYNPILPRVVLGNYSLWEQATVVCIQNDSTKLS
jgi:hypothetical protein